jgi:hypothetical protein
MRWETTTMTVAEISEIAKDCFEEEGPRVVKDQRL